MQDAPEEVREIRAMANINVRCRSPRPQQALGGRSLLLIKGPSPLSPPKVIYWCGLVRPQRERQDHQSQKSVQTSLLDVMDKVPEKSGTKHLGKSFERAFLQPRFSVCPTTSLWTPTMSQLDPSALRASPWLSRCLTEETCSSQTVWGRSLVGLWGQVSTFGALFRQWAVRWLGPHDSSGAFPKHRT